jgi:hypothetical protein
MPSGATRFLRDNVFLVAAVCLPILVVGFFLLSSAIPRWRVPAPAYDLLIRAGENDHTTQRVSLDLDVRDGAVQATARPVAVTLYVQRSTLWLFDHKTMKVRRVPIDVPDLKEGDASRTFPVAALAGRRVTTAPNAPDGYELRTPRDGGRAGIVGDIFGMRRHSSTVAITNRGRVVPVEIPTPYEYYSPASFVGWVLDEGQR